MNVLPGQAGHWELRQKITCNFQCTNASPGTCKWRCCSGTGYPGGGAAAGTYAVLACMTGDAADAGTPTAWPALGGCMAPA